ncbi:DUF2798 domain-containing protein [Dyella kyungheensis]|uniref:DUF2798 domain-containing protein n=1 Tax=Dyella kyungheensis TaxID=1242174 RepID=UPI003CEBDBD7
MDCCSTTGSSETPMKCFANSRSSNCPRLSDYCVDTTMLGISTRNSHYVYGVIQSILTCMVAAAIANLPSLSPGDFIQHWLRSWSVSVLVMLPVVLFAAPWIRRVVDRLACDRRS